MKLSTWELLAIECSLSLAIRKGMVHAEHGAKLMEKIATAKQVNIR